ncbi:MAG: hypothetical protein AAGA55_01825 [Planctomycetota bacterium]
MGLFSRKKARPDPQESATPAVAGAPPPGLDEAVARMRAGDPAAMPAVWDLVLGLPVLYTIGRGQMPDVRPFVGVVDGRPMLAAFTTSDRALDYAKAQGLEGEGGAFAILEQPPAVLIATAASLHAHGVECLLIDEQVGGGYFSPVTNLIGAYEHATGEILQIIAPAGQGEFDHRLGLAESAADQDARIQALNQAVFRLMHLPEWFVVAPDGDPEVPLLREGGRVDLALFTDPWSAQAGLEGVGRLHGVPVEVRRMPVSGIIEAIRGLCDADPPLSGIVVNAATRPLPLDPSNLLKLWEDSPGLRSKHAAD